MNPLGFALLGVLLPATLTGALVLLAWRPRARESVGAWAAPVAAAGVAAGALLGQGLAVDWPSWPVRETYDGQAWLALAAGAVALTAGALRGHAGAAAELLLRLATCSAFAWAWLEPVSGSYEWSRADVAQRAALAGVLGASAWTAVPLAAGRAGERAAAVLAGAVVAAAGASYAILRVRYATGALLLGTAAGVLGAAAAIALWRPDRAAAGGAAGVGTALVAGALFTARYYPDDPMPWAAVALLLAAPALAAVPVGRGRVGILSRAALVAIPVGAAVGLVIRAVPKTADYGY